MASNSNTGSREDLEPLAGRVADERVRAELDLLAHQYPGAEQFREVGDDAGVEAAEVAVVEVTEIPAHRDRGEGHPRRAGGTR